MLRLVKTMLAILAGCAAGAAIALAGTTGLPTILAAAHADQAHHQPQPDQRDPDPAPRRRPPGAPEADRPTADPRPATVPHCRPHWVTHHSSGCDTCTQPQSAAGTANRPTTPPRWCTCPATRDCPLPAGRHPAPLIPPA